ncbi:MAG: long-chain fatty acid--CoA ligase [Chloroflexi bacterium]|nr:long-chain fatty acid--CoA ligase [Chloroflexota bacterium]MBK7180617.1 long-chain fatty acid--CoA ligase [Chloroflexota bacterium]
MYIGDYLGRRAIYSPDKLAIVDTGKTPELRLTYAEMNARANRLAHWLRDVAGVGYGDRVAILARDGVEHLDTFFACAKLGAIHTALNWRLHWRETAAILADTTPKLLIFSADFATAVTEFQHAPEAASVTHYVHLDGEPVGGSLSFNEARLDSGEKATTAAVTEDTTAALIFTGGTTGLPKAAQVTHKMIAWNSLNTIIHDLHHDDIYLNVFPLFHTGGLFVYTLPQVILGGTTILLRQFDPAQVLDLIARERVTVFAGVPTMYQLLTQAANWAEADLASLRFCTSGGAPLPVPLVQKYTAEKGIRFKQGFGMTEFGPGIFALAAEDAIAKAGSIGRPNFYVDARVVDEQNRPLGPNEVGELVLRGPSYCAGYFNNDEATRTAVDEDNWFHTGDLARHDDDWYFFIVDRKKDMFISGGENVYPAEIEKVLYEHTAVHMCAVIGVPDPKWGESGIACVVLKPGAEATADDLMQHMVDRLARYKVPRRVEIMKELPISGAGKILKRDLQERFTAR